MDWPRLPSSVVKSAGRALQVLEYFDDIQCEAKMADIARALHYPESSTSILLRSLVTLGYIDYDRNTRAYCPTSRVRLLGNWVEAPLFRNDRILRFMEDLNAETSDTIILAARNGLNMQYIHVVQAQTALRLHIPLGTLRQMTASVTGCVALSRLPDPEIAKLVRRLNAAQSSTNNVVKISDLLVRIAAVRTDGYAMSRSAVTPGASVLAMPLPNGLTKSPLVIAIGSPTERMEDRAQDLVALLRERIAESLSD